MQLIRTPERYRAALYIRLSKEDEQSGPSQSVTNQRSLLQDYAREQHLTVHDIYIDDGWSGTNFDRPAFQRMICDIESGAVNLVITKDLSRLGRDYILTGHYMERYFPEKQVRYISLLDGIDTGIDSTANDITPFRAIMNDMYAKDISKKIRSVKHDKQRKGLFIGGKPMYGYKMHPTEKNRIIIDEEASAVVRRIFSYALEGMSCRAIAAALNDSGVPSPAVYGHLPSASHSGRWTGERISDMLQNETYLGHMVQGRQAKVSYKSKKCRKLPRDQWIVVPNTHEPLVDSETFRRASAMLSSRRRTRSRTYDFLLKGLIFCRECGHPLGVVNRKTSAGEDRLFFICRTYQRYTTEGICTCHCIREQAVNEAVATEIKMLCSDMLRPEFLLPAARQCLSAGAASDAEPRIKSLQSQIRTASARLDRIYQDKLSGVLEESDFCRIYEKEKADRARLADQLRRLEDEVRRPPPEPHLLVDAFLDTACSRRDLLVSLIERIELSEDRQLYIHYRVRSPEAAFQTESCLQ